MLSYRQKTFFKAYSSKSRSIDSFANHLRVIIQVVSFSTITEDITKKHPQKAAVNQSLLSVNYEIKDIFISIIYNHRYKELTHIFIYQKGKYYNIYLYTAKK